MQPRMEHPYYWEVGEEADEERRGRGLGMGIYKLIPGA